VALRSGASTHAAATAARMIITAAVTGPRE
jgi:hypothetical protein